MVFMKIKELILPFSLALLGTWLLQNMFWGGKSDTNLKTGSEFTAPISQKMVEPLNFNIDFNDAQKVLPLEKQIVDTDNSSIEFSNHGGIIDSITYKGIFTDKSLTLQTLKPSLNKEMGSFLVALNGIGSTPFYYDLVERQKIDSATKIVYQSETEAAKIIKEFIIYDKIFKIDLNLGIQLKDLSNDKLVKARVLFNSPKLPGLDKPDIIQALIYTDQSQLVKKSVSQVLQKGWVSPTLFGSEDRYFVNALVKDENNFTQRAYFRQDGPEQLTSILESGKIKDLNQQWNLEFYFGPKEIESLNAVDSRLEGVMEYGWLWFISKPLLYVLNWLYSLLGNYGWAIVALAILTKIILLPLTLKFNPEDMKRKTEEFNRKLRYIEQKYKNDQETLMKEKMQLIRKQGVMGGFLGGIGSNILLQVPMFIALRRVLQHNLEFYDAPFLWISDISNSDPYYILPLLFGLGIILTMLSGTKFDPRKSLFQIIFVIIMTVLMSKISAGMLLYMVAGTYIGFAQTYFQKAFK